MPYVGGDGLGVIVNHNGLVTQLTRRLDGVHRAPVELHRRTDAVCTGAEHNDRLLVVVVVDVVGRHVVLTLRIAECGRVGVCEVEVVRQFRMLAGNRWNALHAGLYAT